MSLKCDYWFSEQILTTKGWDEWFFGFQCSLRSLEIPVGRLGAGPKGERKPDSKGALSGLYVGILGWRAADTAAECRQFKGVKISNARNWHLIFKDSTLD